MIQLEAVDHETGLVLRQGLPQLLDINALFNRISLERHDGTVLRKRPYFELLLFDDQLLLPVDLHCNTTRKYCREEPRGFEK